MTAIRFQTIDDTLLFEEETTTPNDPLEGQGRKSNERVITVSVSQFIVAGSTLTVALMVGFLLGWGYALFLLFGIAVKAYLAQVDQAAIQEQGVPGLQQTQFCGR